MKAPALRVASALLAILSLPAIFLHGQELTTLTPGTTIERSMKGGESHSYQVALTQGQFLYVEVEQKGIDVEVILFGADGKQISHTDSQNGLWGPEPAVVVAGQAGTYRVQVDCPDKSAEPARYEIRIVALRDATEDDRKHATAEHLMEEGLDASGQQGPDSLQTAMKDYQQALPYFEGSPNKYRYGLLLYEIGVVDASASDFRKAVEEYTRALPIFEQVGDLNMQGTTLNNVGGMYDVLGEPQKAVSFFGRALELERRAGAASFEAATLNNLGKIEADMGEWEKANDYYSQAIPIFHSLGVLPEEANTTHNLAMNYLDLGQLDTALEYLQKALSLAETAGNKQIQANCLEDIGQAEFLLGDSSKAIQSKEQALALRYAAGDPWRAGNTLRGLARVYSEQGDQEKALEYLQKSLEAMKAADDRRDEGVTLYLIGQVYERMKQPQKAIDTENQALALLEPLDDMEDAPKVHVELARAERDLGNLDEARKQAETTIGEVEQVRTHAGAQRERASYFATQQGMYEFYIDLLMRMNEQSPNAGYDDLALQASERARARSLLEMLAESHVDFREGVDQKLLTQEHDLAELMNAKSQRLLEVSGPGAQAQRDALKKEIGELEQQYGQVEVRIRQASPRYAEITEPQPLNVKQIQNEVLDKDTMLLEYSLGDERSYVWAVTTDSVKTYELPKRSEIEQSVREVYEAMTARSTYVRGELKGQREKRIAAADAKLPEAAAKLSQMVLGPVAADLGEKRLAIVTDGSLQHIPFAMLPALSQVSSQEAPTNAERDVSHVSSQGSLANVGHRQAENAEPLVVQHEIVNLPSASMLPILRKEIENRKPAPGMVAVFADPVFSRDDPRLKSKTLTIAAKETTSRNGSRILEQLSEDSDEVVNGTGHLHVPRLPYTREEAERIIKLAQGKDNLEELDFRANLANAESTDLRRYRYLHFATHGYLDSEHPELSAIVLSMVDEKGRPRDGFLRANDIYNLKLPADLVVLSACQTGLGKEIRGEGIVGLTRGFMYAGVPRVIVSLWSVNDRATEELMAQFYEKLLKEDLRPSAALREAQVEMWKQKQWSEPYYWAAFVQQGEWK